MGQAFRRASGRLRSSVLDSSSQLKNTGDQSTPTADSLHKVGTPKASDSVRTDSEGTPRVNHENVPEERDPQYDGMLNQMVGAIRSKPGGKLEMGEPNVVVKCPSLSRSPGRPKKSRYHAFDEEDETPNKKPKRQCGKCGLFGHNSRTCKGAPAAVSSLRGGNAHRGVEYAQRIRAKATVTDGTRRGRGAVARGIARCRGTTVIGRGRGSRGRGATVSGRGRGVDPLAGGGTIVGGDVPQRVSLYTPRLPPILKTSLGLTNRGKSKARGRGRGRGRERGASSQPEPPSTPTYPLDSTNVFC